jgi:hypothetical protein
MKSPKTMDEYIDLVHQAVYEIDELRSCIEDDEEEMGVFEPFVEQLDNQLRALYDEMISGKYQFPGDADLPFMGIVQRYGPAIPFRKLLEVINSTHRKGLAPD